MIDYIDDVATVISEWDVLGTFKRLSAAYDNKGQSTKTWATKTTGYVDIQPLERNFSYTDEQGRIYEATHVAYGYYNVSTVKIDVLQGDRVYVGSKIYEVKAIKDYYLSHLEIFMVYVKGKA